MSINIARNNKKRIVIVGGGFGGLQLANKLKGSDYQVVLVDKNNYHQFLPLIYQVATAGMEPSSIAFPFRNVYKNRKKNFYFRMAEARAIIPEHNLLQTSIGKIEYDYLVFAAGTTQCFTRKLRTCHHLHYGRRKAGVTQYCNCRWRSHRY